MASPSVHSISFTVTPLALPASGRGTRSCPALSPTSASLSPCVPLAPCRIDIVPENTLWVGAWWIGFLGAGAASLLISIPILGYPQRLPGTGLGLVLLPSCAPVQLGMWEQRRSFPCWNWNSYTDFTPLAFHLLLLRPCSRWWRKDVRLCFPP